MRIVRRVPRACTWITQAVGDAVDWLAIDQLLERLSAATSHCHARPSDQGRGKISTANRRLA